MRHGTRNGYLGGARSRDRTRGCSLRRFPQVIMRIASTANQFFWDLTHDSRPEMSWEDDFPLSSPEIWRFVTDFYRQRSKPTVFEYGLGVSTLHHVRNLLGCSGTYEGVDGN